MKDNGWIKLHRKLLENPIVMKDGDHLAIWTWLLLNVTHNGADVIFQGKRMRLQPGQITVGRQQIANELNINESKVRRVLDLFESDQQIDQQMSSKCRLITVKKWSTFQDRDRQNDQQVTNDRPASDQQVTTKQERKNERMKEPEREVALSAPTPSQEAQEFFMDPAKQDQCVEFLLSKGMEQDAVRLEMLKFVSYWTEPTKSGKKQRWELQKAFEIRRRLATWFSNVNKSAPHFNSQPKGMTL